MEPLSGNQRPGLLTSLTNMSLVLRLPSKMHLCRSSSNVMPAIVFGTATKPSRFTHFWPGAEALAPATQNHIPTSKRGPGPAVCNAFDSKCASRHNGVHFFNISTSKNGPTLRCFVHFDLDMCFGPEQRALFKHLNFQRWSEPITF